MFFSEDRQQLQAAKEQNYVHACLSEFEEKSVNDSNRSLAKRLLAWSYLPNLISLVTAGFFIFYLLTTYALWVKLILGALLLAVAATVELGKRGLISEAGKRYFPTEQLPGLLLSGVAVLMLCSMSASYIGGNKLVTENATTPPKSVNPEIDTLKQQLAHELTVSESFRKTTWKGKITRDAVKGMNASRQEQSRLQAKIDELENQDEKAYQKLLGDHNSKTINFGIVLGIVAILADAALFVLLWMVKKLRYEIALLALKNMELAKVEAARESKALAAARFQASQPTYYQQPSYASPSGDNQPDLQNQSLRQPIGFKVAAAETEIATELKPALTQENSSNAMRKHAIRNNALRKEKPKRKGKIKGCAHCGTEFEARTTWHKYCCEKCKVAAWEARTGKGFRKKMKNEE